MGSWIVGFFMAIWFLGFVQASAIATFLCSKLGASEKWSVSLALTAACWLFFFGVFGYGLQLPFPHGVVFDWVHLDITGVGSIFAAAGY